MLPQQQLLRRGLTIAAFALSCFGLLVYLWTTFGGPVPLAAQGYRVRVDFEAATQLAAQADVRISGVHVGHVQSLRTSPDGRTRSVLQIDPQYAPLRADVKALLRAKSLIGETYVELTPGTPTAPRIPDGGHILTSNVSPSVQLDDIMQAFQPKVRRAFGTWMQELAVTGAGRGRDISDSLAQFAPLEEQATELLTILNREAPQLTSLIGGTGRVFAAISARDGQLRSLVQNSGRVFATTAARNKELSATFVAFPTFQRESRKLLTTLHGFINRTDPVISQLTPAFHELSTSFVDLKALAPDLEALITGVGTAQAAGVKGLPATSRFLNDLTPFLGALDPALANLNPLLGYVGAYQQDLLATIANITAATQPSIADDQFHRNLHNARALAVINYDALTSYQKQLTSARKNPYTAPGVALADLTQNGGPATFDNRQCTSALWPSISDGPGVTQRSLDTLRQTIFYGTLNPVAPPCRLAAKRGGGTQFPQLVQDATPTTP